MRPTDERERWLRAFARREGASGAADPAWLVRTRRLAIERFGERGFPTPRDERWRHTSLAPLAKAELSPEPAERNGADSTRFSAFDLGAREAARLVFVNGALAPDLSSFAALPAEAAVGSLAAALAADPEGLEPHFAAAASDPFFVDLNTAFFRDGAFVRLRAGTRVEAPILVVHVSSGASRASSHLRSLVLAGEGSRATIVEHFVSLGEGPSLTNAVTGVVAGPGATLELVRLEEESGAAFHLGRLAIRAERDASIAAHAVTLGGELVRHEVDLLFDGEGADATVNGLYLVDGRRHHDHRTRIDHAKPRNTSRQLYKGVLDGASRGVFEGTIVVRPDAHKTVAHQTNRNLILSREALATSRPVLEIRNDDVRCKHGATIGQLDDDPLFYLRARGVGEEEARALLVGAFAEEVVEAIPVPAVRRRLEHFLRRRLARQGERVEAG